MKFSSSVVAVAMSAFAISSIVQAEDCVMPSTKIFLTEVAKDLKSIQNVPLKKVVKGFKKIAKKVEAMVNDKKTCTAPTPFPTDAPSNSSPLTVEASLSVDEIPQPPAAYELIVPPPAKFTTRTLSVTLTGNFKGKIFQNGNSGVLELVAVQFFDGDDDITHTVNRVDGTDETQGGAHIRRPINLVQSYQVVDDPPDPWEQWGPGNSIFDVGPQGQGLWSGTTRMTEDGNEIETLIFHFEGIKKISKILFHRNEQDEYRERFFRSVTVSGNVIL